MGRPSIYSPELAQAICERLAEGETLASICDDDGMPAYRTARGWDLTNADFMPLSTRAREIGIHKMADDCIAIADNGTNDWMLKNDPDNPGYAFNGEAMQRSKLRIETRIRLIGKWLPKVYGDKVTHSGDPTAPISLILNGSDVNG